MKFILALVVCTLAAGSSSVQAADRALLAKRLKNAAEGSSLDSPALKPWHMKLNVQMYDSLGNPSEQGMVEEWWTPTRDKRAYTTPSYTATEIRNDKGLYRTAEKPLPPYLLDSVRDGVVHPMATAGEIDGARPELKVESLGSVKLDCIILNQPIKNIAYVAVGLFPTYCLDQAQDVLRLSYRFGSETDIRNSMGTFQGRNVALNPAILLSGVKSISAHVVGLDETNIDPSVFTVDPNLTLRDDTPAKVSYGLLTGSIVSTVPPLYPPIARQENVSGIVHLAVVIGTDGRVQRLRVIDTPDASLAVSAVKAVRQWKYKPYMVNSIPVEVETVIPVDFEIGEE